MSAENIRIITGDNLKPDESLAFVSLASLDPQTSRRAKENPEMRERFTLLDGVLTLRIYPKESMSQLGSIRWDSYLQVKIEEPGKTLELSAGKIYKILNQEPRGTLRWLAVGITTNPNGVAINHETPDNIKVF